MAGSRRARWLLPAGAVAVAVAMGGYASAGSAAAEPAVDNPCMNALNNIFTGVPGIPDLGSPLGPGLNINSGNNISIQTGPNNIPPSQSSSVGNNGGVNSNNNVNTCCINGRCCVSTDGGPASCTP
jgi:hypothetical protein